MSRLAGVAVLALLLGACARDSFAVVSVTTYAGTLDGVAQLRVYVTSASGQDVLLYPKQPAKPLHLDTAKALTLSVEFASSADRPATFEVEALAGDGSVLGYGTTGAAVGGSDVVPVAVRIVAGAVRPATPAPGSTADGGSQLACTPAQAQTACGADRTCALLCAQDQAAVAMCYLAGLGEPGDACTTSNDCAPNSQCFTFAADGCSVTSCLRFCVRDADCGQSDAYCNVPIPCGGTSAVAMACSHPCDPTLASGGGCAAGLACFVYAGQTTDCACPGQGGVGASCSQNSGCSGEAGCAGCAAGLSCVLPTGASTGACRPMCKLAAPACPAGTSCHAFGSSSAQSYGYCQ